MLMSQHINIHEALKWDLEGEIKLVGKKNKRNDLKTVAGAAL